MKNDIGVTRVELIKHQGRPVLVGYYPANWAGFPIRAWAWNPDLESGWDEINHVSALEDIRKSAIANDLYVKF